MKFTNKTYSWIVLIICFILLIGLVAALSKATSSINLSSAENFAILAGSTITNTGSSVIHGDVGLSPGTSITGFPPGTINGMQNLVDAVAIQAKADLTASYTAVAGQTSVTTVPTELGGTTLVPGVYDSADGTFGITGTLTLDAKNDSSAVFIFKTASTMITAGSSSIVLINGAQSCNVYWQVGSSATLGASSLFKGTILALVSVTLTTGANVDGRILAQTGAVTLDTNTIAKPTCNLPPTASATPLPSPTPTPTATPEPTNTLEPSDSPTATPMLTVLPSPIQTPRESNYPTNTPTVTPPIASNSPIPTACSPIANFRVDNKATGDHQLELSWTGGDAKVTIWIDDGIKVMSLDIDNIGYFEAKNLKNTSHWFWVENPCSITEKIDPLP